MTDLADIVDLSGDRQAAARQIDLLLKQGKAFAVTGHDVPGDLTAAVRAEARRIFALPAEVKRQMTYTGGWSERGWKAPADDEVAAPDLKEFLAFGNDHGAGDPESDAIWFGENVWPEGFPEFRAGVVTYERHLRSLADKLLAIFALALGVSENFFASHHKNPPTTLVFTWYPAPPRIDAMSEEQVRYRTDGHTDNNTFAILDGQHGTGALQVIDADGEWQDVPYAPNSFTVIAGDLLTRWTGDRWPATVHRIVAVPSIDRPEEELVSIYEFRSDPSARIETLTPPIGKVPFDPIRASDFIMRGSRG